MRISKFWSAVCAAAFLPGFLSVRAQDNPAQAAARAALMEKLSAPNAQPTPPVNKPTVTATPPSVVTQTAPAPTPSETPPAPARANDTPAQATARAALVEKMNDLNAQQPQPANSNLAPIVITPTAAAAEPPGQPANAITAAPPRAEVKPAPAPTSSETPSVTASTGDTPAQTAARAALMDKMNQLNAQQNQPANSASTSRVVIPPTAANPPAVQPTTPVPNVVMTPIKQNDSKAEKAAAKAKAKQEAKQAAADLKAKKEADRKAAAQKAADEAAAKAQAKAKVKADAQKAAAESKSKKNAETTVQKQAARPTAATPSQAAAAPPPKPAAPVVAPAVKPPPANASYAGKSLGFKPVEAPLPPVSAQKQAELQALLAKYVANQISADEYQKERAAILAEP